jgi:hypothetical protein
MLMCTFLVHHAIVFNIICHWHGLILDCSLSAFQRQHFALLEKILAQTTHNTALIMEGRESCLTLPHAHDLPIPAKTVAELIGVEEIARENEESRVKMVCNKNEFSCQCDVNSELIRKLAGNMCYRTEILTQDLPIAGQMLYQLRYLRFLMTGNRVTRKHQVRETRLSQ